MFGWHSRRRGGPVLPNSKTFCESIYEETDLLVRGEEEEEEEEEDDDDEEEEDDNDDDEKVNKLPAL